MFLPSIPSGYRRNVPVLFTPLRARILVGGDGDGAAFVEWAEKFPEDMPYDYLEITITADGNGTRRIVAHSYGSRSRQLLCVWANDSKSRLGKCRL